MKTTSSYALLSTTLIIAALITGCSKTPEDYLSSARDKENDCDWGGAVADINHAIELKPDNPEAYLRRGDLKYEKWYQSIHYGETYDHNLDELNDAIADFNRAIQLKADYADAFESRGEAEAKLWFARGGQDISDRADADKERAYEIKNGHPYVPSTSHGSRTLDQMSRDLDRDMHRKF